MIIHIRNTMTHKSEEVGKRLEEFLLDLRRYLPLLETESSQIKELKRRADLEASLDRRAEIRRLEREIEELKRKASSEKFSRHGVIERKQVHSTQTDVDEYANILKKYEQIVSEKETLNRKYEAKKDENRILKEEVHTLTAKNASLEDVCDSLKTEMKDLERTIRNTEKQNDVGNQQYKNLREDLKRTKEELENTKLRLSQYMGHQLSDNNPNIADLSDKNRPTKLGEMFSSLYDDEYTNAFEEIDTDSTSNKETCGRLLSLLMEAKKFCDDKSEEQLRGLKRECLGQNRMDSSMDSSLVEYSLKEIKEIRKKNAKKSWKSVYDRFVDHMTDRKRSTVFPHPHRYAKTIEYAKKCIELCWLMALQDPPMAFGNLPDKYHTFDANLYKYYTRSGSMVDFVVWPALYLHENGALLCKGVVEPIEDDTRHDFRTEKEIQASSNRPLSLADLHLSVSGENTGTRTQKYESPYSFRTLGDSGSYGTHAARQRVVSNYKQYTHRTTPRRPVHDGLAYDGQFRYYPRNTKLEHTTRSAWKF